MSILDRIPIVRYEGNALVPTHDTIVPEAPLEYYLCVKNAEGDGFGEDKQVGTTLRSPGHDQELMVGYLVSEGVLNHRDQIIGFKESSELLCTKGRGKVSLRLQHMDVDWKRLDRHGLMTSACGSCGKVDLQGQLGASQVDEEVQVPRGVLTGAAKVLDLNQPVFQRTGGLHAAALLSLNGQLEGVWEDVGRHNALDKLIGAQFLAGQVPIKRKMVLLSGRIGYELVQKCAMAGVEVILALGAPTSLSVSIAKQSGITMVGFLKPNRFNIYAGEHRVR